MAAIGSFKRKRDIFEDVEDEENYLSDESEFYGSAAMKSYYEKQARSFNVSEHWNKERTTLYELARINKIKLPTTPKPKPYNPYEGCAYGRQLSETVTQFLARLPPRTTPVTPGSPWIFIANPFRRKPARVKENISSIESENLADFQNEEGDLAEECNWADFIVRGGKMLDELTRLRHDIEKENPGKAKATITRKVNPLKDALVKKLLALAVELKCTSGKWMIFCETSEVDAAWRMVANATVSGELGSAAKVAPDDGEDSRKPRLICVYNDDFTDMTTVKRIATKLKDCGLIGSRGIYYKCCAYTYLHLNRDNEYGIKTSLYSSADVLTGKHEKKGTSDLFYKKKKNEEDWSALEDANQWSF